MVLFKGGNTVGGTMMWVGDTSAASNGMLGVGRRRNGHLNGPRRTARR